MAKYKIEKTNFNGRVIESYRDQDSTPTISIPKDPLNRHYQEYLEWVAAGNTPDPAD